MIIGDPYKFAILSGVINEWNIDDTFCNGVLLFCVNGDIYPKEVVTATLRCEIEYLKQKLIFMAILMLTLTGCGKAEQERLIIYSFSGENEQLVVSNGIIVLNGTEETFVGGDLKVTGDFFDDITSYSTTFYTMSGSEKDIILSNSVVDMTGGTVNVSSDLGQISGESTIRRIKIEDANDLESTLYFELAAKDKNGKESVYQLQMSLTEITQTHSN